MKKLYLLLSVLFLISYLNGQHWIQTYGEGNGVSVDQTNDGGFILIGSVNIGWEDIHIIRTNDIGDTIWTKTFFNSGGREYGYDVKQTSDDGFIILGLDSNPQSDFSLVKKTDINGEILWSQQFENFYGKSIEETSDGGYIISGHGIGYGYIGCSNIEIKKLNLLGEELWSQNNIFGYEGCEVTTGWVVQETMDGGFIVITDEMIIKLNHLGNTQWTNENMGGNYVQQTSDGGYIVLGWFNDDNNNDHISLIKSNEQGNLSWYNYFGGDCSNNCYNGRFVQETSDQGFIFFGRKGDEENWIVKTDSSGYMEWDELYEIPGYTNGGILTTDGTMVFVGRIFDNHNNTSEIFLSRTLQLLNIQSESIPHKFYLNQSYPNPFNPSTTLDFSIPFSDNVNIRVLDIVGREVDVVINEYLTNGNHRIEWSGQGHPSGIYFISFESGGFIETQKVVLMK